MASSTCYSERQRIINSLGSRLFRCANQICFVSDMGADSGERVRHSTF